MNFKINEGDIIGVVGVSNSLGNKNILEKAVKMFEANNLKIELSDNIEEQKYGMCGDGKKRAQAFMKMIKDGDVKAIICLEGGNSCNNMIDYLDYDIIKNNPKPIIGYSDVTVLLETISKMSEITTFHGPNFLCFGKEYGNQCMENFKNVFMNNSYKDLEDSKIKIIKKGDCLGNIIGTNLECTLYLAGTKYFPLMDNAILFVERYITTPSETYNEFYRLKQLGVLDKIKGLVIGYNYSYKKEETGIKFEDIALEICKDYNFPIYKIETFGHKIPNIIIPIGAYAKIVDGKIVLD